MFFSAAMLHCSMSNLIILNRQPPVPTTFFVQKVKKKTLKNKQKIVFKEFLTRQRKFENVPKK